MFGVQGETPDCLKQLGPSNSFMLCYVCDSFLSSRVVRKKFLSSTPPARKVANFNGYGCGTYLLFCAHVFQMFFTLQISTLLYTLPLLLLDVTLCLYFYLYLPMKLLGVGLRKRIWNG